MQKILVSTHTMLRAALKPRISPTIVSLCEVSTHTMLRAALKRAFAETKLPRVDVPTHTMLRAALKPLHIGANRRVHRGLDTHNAACGSETINNDVLHKLNLVSTHTMLRAALTAKRLCVSFRSHRAVFVCKKRTAILTMRRTDVRTDKFSTTILTHLFRPHFGGKSST